MQCKTIYVYVETCGFVLQWLGAHGIHGRYFKHTNKRHVICYLIRVSGEVYCILDDKITYIPLYMQSVCWRLLWFCTGRFRPYTISSRNGSIVSILVKYPNSYVGMYHMNHKDNSRTTTMQRKQNTRIFHWIYFYIWTSLKKKNKPWFSAE